ncbi:MFS transporter [Amycolatopsis viridis]|uniref:AAHS family benzoate transporter-like MFS transporter n=1 Tax=Amycolatopsis viridis TaxID=185678 RepID=A0ABX0ST85_9PSEU|nr:MFS transporter [Amycolatopsis viridis]NIH79768.1 AAHS family benzoate transporter-like MFS transporter [Amycolatopsis viridis]
MELANPPRTGAPAAPRHVVVAVCMIVTVIEGYNLIVYGSVVPLLLADPSLGLTADQTGLIGGVVYLGAVLGALLAPVLADRTSAKSTLATGIAVFGLGALAFAVATNGTLLGFARLLNGLGVGAALTTAMTIARDQAPARRASLVVTITMAGIPLGGVVAALLAIPVLPAFGWRAMFVVGTALSVLIFAVLAPLRIPADPARAAAEPAWSGRRKLAVLVAGRGKWITLAVAGAVIANMIAWQGLNVWAAQAMIDLGFSLRGALLFTFALTGAAVLGSFGTAWAADRRGSARIAVVTGTCTIAGLAGMLTLPTGAVTAALCIALMGIGGHSTMNLVHTTTSTVFPAPARAAALGWSNGTSFVGAFFGPTLGGIAIGTGGARALFATFAVAAGVCLVAVTALFLLSRKEDTPAAPIPR